MTGFAESSGMGEGYVGPAATGPANAVSPPITPMEEWGMLKIHDF
ncbi:hypothetical protein [Edaphobacter aggregans]|nr:hypothetical protein [Edaphobacter aggregans]